MRALRFHGPQRLEPEDVPDPTPGDGDAIVALSACGVCGSDLHFLDGTARTRYVPITLGHEIAGIVRHPGVSGLPAGTAVVVTAGTHCGSCRRCGEGRFNLCERMEVIGIDRDGGLADLVAVPGSALVPIPAGLTPIDAATAVDAGATAYHAVTRSAGLAVGETVAVIGVGGLGGYAVQMARNQGAALVIAADVDAAALRRASTLGADETVLIEPDSSVGRRVKLLTDGGVDVALEFVGRAASVDAAIKSLRPGGRAIAVGVGVESLVTLPPVLWSNNEYQLRGSYGSLPGDTEAVLAGLAAGSLVPPPIRVVALEDAAPVILEMSSGAHPAGGGRLVVTP